MAHMLREGSGFLSVDGRKGSVNAITTARQSDRGCSVEQTIAWNILKLQVYRWWIITVYSLFLFLKGHQGLWFVFLHRVLILLKWY